MRNSLQQLFALSTCVSSTSGLAPSYPKLNLAQRAAQPADTDPIFSFEELVSSAVDEIKSQVDESQLVVISVTPITSRESNSTQDFRNILIFGQNSHTSEYFEIHNADGTKDWSTIDIVPDLSIFAESQPFDWKDFNITLDKAFAIADADNKTNFQEIIFANQVAQKNIQDGGFYYTFRPGNTTEDNISVEAGKGKKLVGAIDTPLLS